MSLGSGDWQKVCLRTNQIKEVCLRANQINKEVKFLASPPTFVRTKRTEPSRTDHQKYPKITENPNQI